jgi:Fic family protein
VHYEAPPASKLDAEMTDFIDWTNRDEGMDPVLKSAIAHLWFVIIHPFDDGNGRIARAIADLVLARAEDTGHRFYSMSSQIRHERNDYYRILEHTQKGSLDVTAWLQWFIGCLGRALDRTETTLASVLRKARFWERQTGVKLNDRQHRMLNMLLDGFEGKLTSSKWAKITQCSQDTAGRDIQDLIEKGVLVRDEAGGRSTSYSLAQQ